MQDIAHKGGLWFIDKFSKDTITINKNRLNEKRVGIKKVSGEILKDIFATNDNLKLVVLNSCFSTNQANEISKDIDFVIAMETEIKDNISIEFTNRLYQAIASDIDIKTAFNQTKTQLKLDFGKESDIPILYTKENKKIFKLTDIVNITSTQSTSSNTTINQIGDKNIGYINSINELNIN